MRSSYYSCFTKALRFVQSFWTAKVCDFNITIEVAENIVGFDVSMYDARLMDVF